MGSDEHVVLLAFPFGTHAAPLFFLAWALAAASPRATFPFFNSTRSNASIARSTAAAGPAPDNLRVYDVTDGCPTRYELPTDDPEKEVRLFLAVTPANFREAMAAVEDGGGRKISCLMSDAFLCFAGKMAEEMRVPWVPLWTGGPASLAAHLYTDLLRLTIGGGEQGKLPLCLILLSLPRSDGHPLHMQAPASMAYVSFGTVISPTPPELAELAAGLEASGLPFLWSLKNEWRERLPAGFLDRTGSRGLVMPWAPQVEVLGHVAVDAFVTHCGWNSVMESLAGGVPMSCRPFLGDQCINARMVSHVWEIGVGFACGTLTCGGVKEALNVVLRTRGGERTRERAGELRKKAVRAVGPGGSSVQNLKALVGIVLGN